MHTYIYVRCTYVRIIRESKSFLTFSNVLTLPRYAPYQTPSDNAYNYYGARDPLNDFPQPQSSFPAARQHYAAPVSQPQVPTPGRSRPQQVAVGAIPLGETNKDEVKRSNQQTYQNELKRQVCRLPPPRWHGAFIQLVYCSFLPF
mgnify:CR=1 FL=1